MDNAGGERISIGQFEKAADVSCLLSSNEL
jgi:hypothetical protein